MKMFIRLMVPLAFLGMNLFLGEQILQKADAFRLLNSRLAIDTLIDPCPPGEFIIDIDRDGRDEIIFNIDSQVMNKRDLWLADIPPADRIEKEIPGKKIVTIPHSYNLFDAWWEEKTNRGVFKCLALEKGDLALKELYLPGNRWKSHKFDSLQYRLLSALCSFDQPEFVDLDGDGRQEMIFILRSFYIHYPRGAVCFDAISRKSKWQYYGGTLFNNVAFSDLDGDNGKEVILSSAAVNNGADTNGTDDSHSYVIVLDCTGKELWKRSTGGWYTSVDGLVIKDIDLDKKPEIIVSVGSHRAQPRHKGMIYILDSRTGEIKNLYPNPDASFSTIFVKDFGVKHPRLYAGDGAGCILMFDYNLRLLKKTRHGSQVFVINQFTPAVDWPYLITLSKDRLAVYDWDLNRKAFEYHFAPPARNLESISSEIFRKIHSPRGDSALVRSDKLYRLRQIKRSLPGIVQNLIISGLLPLIIGLILFDAFFFYALRRLGEFRRYDLKEQRQNQTRRFLDILQEIAYKLKTPVTDLSWTIEKVRQNIAAVSPQEVQDDFSRLAEFLDEDIGALKRKSNQLLRLIQAHRPQFKNTALKPVLEKLVTRFRALAGEKIAIRFSMDEDVSLNIDEELFKEALANVLDNALEAIPAGGTVTLSAVVIPAALKKKAKQVLIEVEDTGCGIDEADLDRVFEPFFSRKEATGGSGLGLTICRYIIAVHGGGIDIHSRRGFGARVQILLPVDGVKVER